MSPNDTTKLSPLATHWHNRSHSSLNSCTTYHSAQAHYPSPIELEQSRSHQHTKPEAPSILTSIKMARQDSGYSEGRTPTPPPRPVSTSSFSSQRPTPHKRYSAPPSSTSASRPSNRRSSRPSQPRSSTSSARPSQYRSHTYNHPLRTVPTPETSPNHQPYTFFQFPSLVDNDSSDTQTSSNPPAPPPPCTVHYWTSDQTRRLEYAAIDAASKGVRGFVIRLIPDCFLSEEKRRTKFSDREDGGEMMDDCGSVRRYRLCLEEEHEEEKNCVGGDRQEQRKKGGSFPMLLRRWSFGGRGKR